MKFLFITLFLSLAIQSPTWAGVYSHTLSNIAVQDGGRIKPFDSFARESLQLIYGKQKYKKSPAVEIIFTWMLLPDVWSSKKIIQIRHSGLREALNLDDEIYHSSKDLTINRRLGIVFQELRSKKENEERLNSYFQAVNTLKNQIVLFHAISQGLAPRIWPQEDSWVGPAHLQGQAKESFQRIAQSFSSYIKIRLEHKSAIKKNDQTEDVFKEFSKSVNHFQNLVMQENNHHIDYKKVQLESHYNRISPNTWSWVFLFLAAILFASQIVSKSKFQAYVAWSFVALGILAICYGMALRIFIMGRPPVTNMYETVIWVPLITLIIASLIEKIYSYKFVILSACISSGLLLILSGLSPAVLDETLTPLEPVLRDNFWLITHVIMIVSSYGAFLLAFILGDLLLFYYLRGENKYEKQIKQGTHAIYRSIQIGVVLLAGGTILGGVWADYSWGRFWGWDPKETWAFITLMGYLALLHGRLAGWFKNFSMVVGSILTFSLVIMAWYGVNFVLGAGLHSYGFGAGGVEYVAGFVALHLLFVAYVSTFRLSSTRSSKNKL